VQLEHIDIECAAEMVEDSPDHAATFALLVTELVTNAAKHAYGASGGTVHVRLTRDGQNRLLEVRDEGVGLGSNFKIESMGEESLGMNLIQALTQTLGGTVEIGDGQGATFKIKF
jgi:two-component sensor histidine kinase